MMARAASRNAQVVASRWKQKTIWRALIRQPDGTYRGPEFSSKSAADAYVKAQHHAQRIGIDLDRAKEPLRAVVDRWLEDVQIEWGVANRAQVDSFLNAHILPEFGDWPVGKIVYSDVAAWRARMRRDGLAPSTQRRLVRLLGRVLDTSVRDGAIAKNPCAGIQWPKAKGSPRPGLWIEREVMMGVLVPAMPERYQVATMTGYGGALRFQELAGLRRNRVLAPGEGSSSGKVVSMVDADSFWRVRVDSVIIEVKGRLEEKVTPKTDAGLREVPIPNWLAHALMDHCERFDVGPTDLVFMTSSGTPLRRGNFSKRVLYPRSEATLGKRVRTHDLRRSGISQWIADGIPAEVAQVWAGHADLRTTMRIYHEVFPSTEIASVARLQESNSEVTFDIGWSTFGRETKDAQSAAS
jgi:integrase